MASTPSNSRQRPAPKKPSAAYAPLTSIPFAFAAAIAGSIMVNSSTPSAPPSPAWGFNPSTAIRGPSIPKSSRRDCASCAILASTRACVSAPGTSDRLICCVTNPTRRSSDTIIISGSFPPLCAAKYSVWPGYANPAPCITFVFTGSVTMASRNPCFQSRTLDSSAMMADSADSREAPPGSTRKSPPTSTRLIPRSEASRAPATRTNCGICSPKSFL